MADFTFAPLTPASFLDRSAAVFAERLAVVDGQVRLTYADLAGRCADWSARWPRPVSGGATGWPRCAQTVT